MFWGARSPDPPVVNVSPPSQDWPKRKPTPPLSLPLPPSPPPPHALSGALTPIAVEEEVVICYHEARGVGDPSMARCILTSSLHSPKLILNFARYPPIPSIQVLFVGYPPFFFLFKMQISSSEILNELFCVMPVVSNLCLLTDHNKIIFFPSLRTLLPHPRP